MSKELKHAVLKFDRNFPVAKGSGMITVHEWVEGASSGRLFSSVNVSSPTVKVAGAGDWVSVPLYPYADDTEADDTDATRATTPEDGGRASSAIDAPEHCTSVVSQEPGGRW